MKFVWLKRSLISVLIALIMLPMEQDGLIDLSALGFDRAESPYIIGIAAPTHKNAAQVISNEDSRHLAISFRSRYDFMDYFYEVFAESERFKVFFHSNEISFTTYYYTRLISVLLLSIPPPNLT
ncbi:hypothetical protein LEP1GSC050_0462 [Leptospira broomii serovar Hurstbridge str. 5399]|uniref:Uncharacterized protein n=1 Tax=Leptospira broomii serovar Hurstbridge str. 5399 TaxID=1049789 RepID=T0FFM2_9LEPT|nr:hypothetical protein [Leptospira broomii]EQA46412.1 hypothetical protein LEP1GSC050_0462 [Leptospira broomii serovar Hurstbridge str. 5399]